LRFCSWGYLLGLVIAVEDLLLDWFAAHPAASRSM
jgi:hypothetical protein